MNRRLIASLLAITLSSFVGEVRAQDKDIITTGQQLVKQYSNAVVNITATVKITISGGGRSAPPREQKQEVLATIIDPSGLAITSLMTLDPGSAVQNVRVPGQGGETINVSVKSDVSDVRYRLPDGTEVPGRIVLKDEDLDLAFIAPEKPLEEENKSKIVAISLNEAAADVQLLEPVISLGRLDKDLSYEPAVNAARLSAKLRKPRTEYLAGGAIGGPSFTVDGKLLGICLVHRSGGTDLDTVGGRGQRASTEVIIPAADIAEVAIQAMEEMKKPAPTTAKSETPATMPAAESKE